MITPDRIRLLKFATVFAIGGTERHVMNFVAHLDRSRFDLHLACLHRSGQFLSEIEARQIPLAEYPVKRLYGPRALRQQARFGWHLRQRRTQIVHTYGFYANVFGIAAARLAATPVVIASIRDTGIYLTPRQKQIQKIVCRMADLVLVNAEAIRQALILEGYQPEKITVIRNGVSPSAIRSRSKASVVRKSLGLPQDAPVVVMLARLDEQKGVGDFLQAASSVAARVPDARFVIVGDGPMLRKGAAVNNGRPCGSLADRVATLGLQDRIVFTGFRMDVSDVLSECAVSVLPSVSEGLSNTLLESMAAGLPVVATDVGGNPEVVHDGRTGFLVPVQNPVALADRICRLLEDRELANRFGDEGRRRVIDHFSIECMLRDTQALYQNLLERPTSDRRRCWSPA